MLDCRGILDEVTSAVRQHNRCIVASGNVHSFNLAARDMDLREFINGADIVRLDGAGVALAAKLLGYQPPPRMTWADFAFDLAEHSSANDLSIYLLGNRPGVADAAASKLLAASPGLHIAGTQHGYFSKGVDDPENLEIIQKVNGARADILVVGLGMPLQERWIAANACRIKTPVIMTAGAAFEWIADLKPRAPLWMCNNGMEWLWRLFLEPRRLFSRYIVGNPLFMYRVFKQLLINRQNEHITLRK